MSFAKLIHPQDSGWRSSIGDHIPMSSHVTPSIIKLRDSDRYICTWKIEGLLHETVDADDLASRKNQLNQLWKSIGSSAVSVWVHNVRRRFSDRLYSEFSNDYCRRYDQDYYDSFEGYAMMATEIYLTLVYDANPVLGGKTMRQKNNRSLNEYRELEETAIRQLEEIGGVVEVMLNKYSIEPLSTYEDEKGVRCSEPMEFYQFLLSGKWQKVRLSNKPIHNVLGGVRYFPGYEIGTIRSPSSERLVQFISITDYTDRTEAGLLNQLMYEDYEFIITQSFTFLPKNEGVGILKRQYQQLMNAGDLAATQVAELGAPGGALDQLTQGQFLMGEYHFTMGVFADNEKELHKNRASAMAMMTDQGFIVRIEDEASAASYFSQLPGNFRERPRIAYITSRNFAGLSSFHNFPSGKRDGNPWGQCVTLLKSPSGQPTYFNYHSTKEKEDSEDKKAPGNTIIIGATGAGKTVLMTHMMLQMQKYEALAPLREDGGRAFSTVFFDKDRGAELSIRRAGGKYFRVQNGQSTGFNPFQMPATEDNIIFMVDLARKLAETDGENINPLRPSQVEELDRAIRDMMRHDREERNLSRLTGYLQPGKTETEKEMSVNYRLRKWTRAYSGSLAWVFDNDVDTLSFDTHSINGIDGTEFLDNKTTRSVLSMYLLYRMEQAIDGRWFNYTMDEFWKWVLDKYFGDFAFNKQKTIRKQNGFGVFGTQSPADVLKSENAKALVEQSITQIFLPNRKADYDDYVTGFKCTPQEFGMICELAEESRTFLIKQDGVSRLGTLNLNGARFSDHLAIMSGSEDNIALLDETMDELGTEDPALWEPEFHKRRKARMGKNRR
jgi:type IV secretion/conjugal transfer VirB4 family ATPase